VDKPRLLWQSKAVLLLVLPAVGASVVLEAHWWLSQAPPVAIWTVGLSALLGLVALQLRSATAGAATAGAAAAGAAITATLMFSTVSFPYLPWRTALVPVVTVLLFTSIATRVGRKLKEDLGAAESRRGRRASQVAANLGIAALVSSDVVQAWIADSHWFSRATLAPVPVLAPALAALAEAAADTVSSELGQVLSGHPRMITTLRRAQPGTDGAISVGGSIAGVIAAAVVATAGSWALRGGLTLTVIGWAGGVFGLFFDSLLGATLERRGWLNNDAVNFLSTASSALFALGALAILPHAGLR
jgi:uncharacterized protein (TIGR00297 family)